MRMHRFTPWILLALMVVAVPAALAQDEDHGETYDTTLGSLVIPTIEDFAPAGEEPATAESPVAGSNLAISAYVDVTDQMKSGVLTPSYRFSPAFTVKARVPIIWDRTLNYWGYDASAGGLGDIVLDGDYTKTLSAPGTLLRFGASVKLPTGDDEKTVKDDSGLEYAVPLGTGTTDFLLRGQYSRSTARTGLLVGLMFRKNTPGETIQDWGSVTATTTRTMGSEVIASTFGRYRIATRWWINLGGAVILTGDGKSETEYSDGTPTIDNGAEMGGTLVDLFPGVSYKVGKISPFLGIRIPLVTSYNSDFRDEERDTAFIFQVSYRPGKLLE